MFNRIRRLFTIKTRFEAFAVIYALAVGAVERGQHYLVQYPGPMGYVFFAICTCAIFMAGGRLLDSVRPRPPGVERRQPRPPGVERRQAREPEPAVPMSADVAA